MEPTDKENPQPNLRITSGPDWITDDMHTRSVRKGEVLQQPGNLATKAFFVKSGLLRSYTIDDNGKIHIFMFAPEGWVISDIQSHTYSEPAELFIDVIEDSEVIEMPQRFLTEVLADAETLTITLHKFRRRISVLQKRVIMLMSASASQRYAHFLETYPQLANRVPQKMIASYLGITPEALSNIRSQIRKSHK